MNSLNVGLAPSPPRVSVEVLSIRECPERCEPHSQQRDLPSTDHGFHGRGQWCSMRKTVRDGVDVQEESEFKQESEPNGGDHSAAIDHSVGSGRRRFGFLLGPCLSPPLALATSKNKTPISCTAPRDRLVGQSESAKYLTVPTVSNPCEAFGFAEMLNTYLARYSLVAFVSRFGIDSTKASMV